VANPRLKVALRGDLERMMREYVTASKVAASRAMEDAVAGLRQSLRRQVRAARLGRLERTLRHAVYPTAARGGSLDAAGEVYSKTRYLFPAFDRGVTIRSKAGFWLALPTDAAPKRIRGKRPTPDLVEFDVVARNEAEETASIAGTASTLAVALFSQFHGVLLIDGRRAANITGGDLSLSNQLSSVETIDGGGLISGVDPDETAIGLDIRARYSDNLLKRAADAEAAVNIRYGFANQTNGAELLIELHELHLPKPRREISGAGGIEVTYAAVGAQKAGLGRAATVTLYNDVAAGGYTPVQEPRR